MDQIKTHADTSALLALSSARSFVDGRVKIPGSKSITNRALLIAALATGKSQIFNPLRAEDTRLMVASLRHLGVKILWREEEGLLEVEGSGGNLRVPAGDRQIEVGNAGTVARFLLPLLCLAAGEGASVVRGCQRMEERPIGALVAALRSLGAQLESVGKTGARGFPLRVQAGTGLAGGRVKVGAEVSSQFVSALLLSAPYGREDLTLCLEGTVVSASYIALTRQMMANFGVRSEEEAPGVLRVAAPQVYRARRYRVAGDASSASYFFALAAIAGGTMLVEGLVRESEQGDLGLVALLAEMGCGVQWEDDAVRISGASLLRGVDASMRTMSDVALTLAVVALFAEGITKIREVEHMRFKECDRLAAFACEVRKLGAQVEVTDDGLRIHGGQPLRGAQVATYNDHRMAMALSLIALRVPGMVIENPRCVEKTYPGFFADFFAASGVRGTLIT
jgi:3-phosphoshikimate 1-carboxyvinyltransferase